MIETNDMRLDNTLTYRITVHGSVQGVGYRYYCQQRANALHITGWVKNTYHGTVEISCKGEEESLRKFVEWCKRGPATARVSRVDITPMDSPSHIASSNTSFDIVY